MLFGESFQADVRHINGDIARGIFPEGRSAGQFGYAPSDKETGHVGRKQCGQPGANGPGYRQNSICFGRKIIALVQPQHSGGC